ncbi:urea ABC transporter permease subunit UrtC [Paenibacillus septentrionalis]|uniref:Urea ABC transporter permease subunit UrtC n=1 Tax=Paenibacillus septentrionalis TaxID=429342 RepID=A0ABW1V8C0_9BACL
MIAQTEKASFHKKIILTSVYSIVVLLLLLAPLYLSDFRLSLLAKFLAFAIVAIGLDLIWGYSGILSLGHGVFFGLGAYCMGMFLKLEATGGKLPDFMSWSGLSEVPWFWKPFAHAWFAFPAGILLPMALAFVLGFFTFRNRIRGVYFTILTQALVIIMTTLFIGQQQYTGGTNGITGFQTIFGFALRDSSTKIALYLVTVAALIAVFIACKRLVGSRSGRVLRAVRDAENRARFIGYNPSRYQLFVFCLSAGIAGLAGMLFVLHVGIISPTTMGIVPSIEIVLWVALGGRGTLIGAVIGAVAVNAAKSGLSETYPDSWLFFLGALFVIVVVFLPKGLVGLGQDLALKIKRRLGKDDNSSTYPVLRERDSSL